MKEEFKYKLGDEVIVLEETGTDFPKGRVFIIQKLYHGVHGHAVYTDKKDRYCGVLQQNCRKLSKLEKILR
jgi:hypothetical protein